MTLQLIPSEFPYIWGKFYFLFFFCTVKHCVVDQRETKFLFGPSWKPVFLWISWLRDLALGRKEINYLYRNYIVFEWISSWLAGSSVEASLVESRALSKDLQQGRGRAHQPPPPHPPTPQPITHKTPPISISYYENIYFFGSDVFMQLVLWK